GSPPSSARRLPNNRCSSPGAAPSWGRCRNLQHKQFSMAGPPLTFIQNLHVAIGSVYADCLTIPNNPGSMFNPDDCGQTVFPGNDCTMGHEAPDFRHQTADGDEQRRPTGVRVGGNKDVPRFEGGRRHVPYDAGP